MFWKAMAAAWTALLVVAIGFFGYNTFCQGTSGVDDAPPISDDALAVAYLNNVSDDLETQAKYLLHNPYITEIVVKDEDVKACKTFKNLHPYDLKKHARVRITVKGSARMLVVETFDCLESEAPVLAAAIGMAIIEHFVKVEVLELTEHIGVLEKERSRLADQLKTIFKDMSMLRDMDAPSLDMQMQLLRHRLERISDKRMDAELEVVQTDQALEKYRTVLAEIAEIEDKEELDEAEWKNIAGEVVFKMPEGPVTAELKAKIHKQIDSRIKFYMTKLETAVVKLTSLGDAYKMAKVQAADLTNYLEKLKELKAYQKIITMKTEILEARLLDLQLERGTRRDAPRLAAFFRVPK